MIIGCVVVPQPPLLLPGLGDGIAEVAHLRGVCGAAIDWLCGLAVHQVVVVASGARSEERSLDAADPTSGYCGAAAQEATAVLPLGLAVGRALVGDRVRLRLHSVAADASADDALALGAALADSAEPTGLLVVGDGSARRGEKAPGYLDARAARFDAGVERALAQGDTDALAALDVDLADELLVSGRAAWQVLAGAAAGGVTTATLDYSADPFGVWYAVARWSLRR